MDLGSIERSSEPNVYKLLAERARRASDGRLVVYSVVGLSALVVVIVFRVQWWGIAMPFVALGAFGLWGIAERSEREIQTRAALRALAGARWIALVSGTCAALLTGATFMAAALGKMIS
ncbi:MAG: hypothetical protein ACRENI_03005 [Gemmatimonadaceae bacterium]